MLEGPDLLVILGVMILFFGSAKIPQLARSLGRAKGEFERGAREVQRELDDEARVASSPNTHQQPEQGSSSRAREPDNEPLRG
jgi:sec-independent protein translocase protein TatA